jgi:ethanolamine utilization protein EutN
MLICEVVGTVVSTYKHYKLEGRKILLVQPLGLEGESQGRAILAVDSVDAGEGDRVLVVQEGKSASMAAGRPESPLDAAVVGVIDTVTLK